MATYVLVHGAWSGAHGFRSVRPLLTGAGHAVFTPSLTGIGERVHLASPQVRLGTHVSDVVNQMLYEDLRDVVLLGFSYGGFVVTGALEHVADRVRHLVYLDAFVPAHGDTLVGMMGGAPTPITLGEEWLVPPAEREFDDA
ncbi:MAG: alpha/beta fold hydrolase, partial [Ilumatobacteraceae bacterium]